MLRHVALAIFALGLAAAGLATAEPPPVQPPLFPPGDALIGAAASRQETPQAVAGGDLSLVVWADHRSNFEALPPFQEEQTARDVYAARLDAAGEVLDTTPIVVCQAYGYQRAPRACWNGSTWLVVWEHQGPTQYYYESQVWGARVAPDGTLLDEPFQIVEGFGSSGLYLDVACDGTNWLVIAQGFDAGDPGVLGVRVSPAGAILDPVPVVLIPQDYYLLFNLSVHSAGGEYLLNYTAINAPKGRRYAADLTPVGGVFDLPGISIGSNGARYYIAWSSGGTLRGSPMETDGTLVYPSGLPLTPSASVTDARVTWDGARWWVSWQHAIEGIETTRVLDDGSVIDYGGVPLDTPNESWMSEHRIASAPGGGLRVVWKDRRAGGFYPEDVWAAGYSDAAVPGPSAPVSLGAPAQRQADLVAGPGGFLLVMNSEVSGQRRIKAQRLGPSGQAVDAEPIVVASGPTLSGPAVDWNGSVYLIAWSDGEMVRVRRYAADLTPLDASPIAVMNGTQPDVAALGDLFLVVTTWYPSYIEFVHPLAKRVDGATGDVLDAQAIWLGQYYARAARVVAFGDRWFAVWQRHASHDETPAYPKGNFVSTGGIAGSEFYLSGAPTTGFGIDVAVSETHALVIWSTGSWASANNDLAGSLMNPDGTFLPPAGGFIVSAADYRQRDAAAAWLGAEFLAVWSDKRNAEHFFDNRTDVYGARVSDTGAVLDPAGFAAAATALPEMEPALVGADGYALLGTSILVSDAPHASYRLGVIGIGDAVTAAPADSPAAPRLARLLGASPNPFNPATRIRFALAAPARAWLSVHDATGRRLRTLIDTVLPAGERVVAWDGRDDAGAALASGVYLLRLEAGGEVEAGKVVLIK